MINYQLIVLLARVLNNSMKLSSDILNLTVHSKKLTYVFNLL